MNGKRPWLICSYRAIYLPRVRMQSITYSVSNTRYDEPLGQYYGPRRSTLAERSGGVGTGKTSEPRRVPSDGYIPVLALTLALVVLISIAPVPVYQCTSIAWQGYARLYSLFTCTKC